MSERLTVRHEDDLWTCICEGQKLETIGFVDLMVLVSKELGTRRFSIEFDCDGKAIDGVTATFDWGDPDTYVPD